MFVTILNLIITDLKWQWFSDDGQKKFNWDRW